MGFYQLIQKIQKRPSLYLGQRSITHLQTFLDGYTFACREVGIPITNEEREFDEFQDWIEQRFDQPSTQSWARIILFYSEDERDALDRFFELFTEFLQRNQNSTNEDVAISGEHEPRISKSHRGNQLSQAGLDETLRK